jgi:sialidase-1
MTLGQRLLPSTGAAAFTPCTTAIPGGSPATVINDTEHNAFPGVARMANGNLIVVYRKGSDHSGSQDGNLIYRTSADNGATWSTETTFYNHATLDARDPEVTVLADGTVIVLFFLHTEATGLGDVYVIRSTDNGAAWGTPVALGSSFTSYEFCSAKVVELTDGTLIAPLYGNTGGDYTAYLMKSSDGGDTWGTQTTIATGSSRSWVEPYMILLASGVLHCLIRTDENTIYRSTSSDSGATWSAAASAFTGNGRPSHIETPCGALIYVGRPSGVGDPEYRTSTDKGATWSAATVLDTTGDNMVYASMVAPTYRTVLCVYGVESPSPTYTESDIYSQVFTLA